MPTTAWKSPSAAANLGSGGTVWTNPGNILSSNNSYATVVSASNSDYLVASGFGFTTADVPSGATIIRLECEVERKASTSSVGAAASFSLNASSFPELRTDGNPFTTVDSTTAFTQSNAADPLWGLSPSDADIRTSTFSVAYTGITGTATLSVDHIRARVQYSVPAVTNLTVDSVAYTLTASDISLARSLPVDSVAFAFVTSNITFSAGKGIAVDAIDYIFAVSDIGFGTNKNFAVDSVNFDLGLSDITFSMSVMKFVDLDSIAYTVTASPITFSSTFVVPTNNIILLPASNAILNIPGRR